MISKQYLCNLPLPWGEYLFSGVDGCWVWSPGFSRSELAYYRVARNFFTRREPRTLCRLKAGLQTFYRALARANRFDGFYALRKPLKRLRTLPSHSHTPLKHLKQGVNEKNQFRMAWL